MKFLIALPLLVLPFLVAAQDSNGLDPAQMQKMMDPATMQKMMEQAQKAQACMAQIDQSQLQALEAEGEAANKEIKALCRAGDRDAAQSKAIVYGKQMVDKPVIKELQLCMDMMDMVIPQTAWAYLEDSETQAHVCNL